MINKDYEKMSSSQESYENSAKAIINAREFYSVIDQAVTEYFDREGTEQLKGKGRPINYEEGDAIQIVLKNANFKPAWVELRKEIIEDMKQAILQLELVGRLPYVEQQIDDINNKIRKLNRVVPHPQFQRGLVTIDNLKTKYELWL